MKFLPFLLSTLCLLIPTLSASSLNCAFIPVNFTIYYLCPFAFDPPSKLNNFGDLLNLTLGTSHQLACPNTTADDVWATYQTDEVGCLNLATSDPTYSLSNSGLNITFDPVESLGDGNHYQLQVNLICNGNLTDSAETQFTYETQLPDDIDGTTYILVSGASKYGCPAASINIASFMAINSTLFAIVFGVLGVILCLFGLKFINFAIFSIVAVLGTLAVSNFFFMFITEDSAQWMPWAMFAVSLMLGSLLGYFALKLEKIAFYMLGAALGQVAGLMLFSAVVEPFTGDKYGSYPLYITIGVCAIVGGFLAVLLIESILIISTSVIGSYLLIRSASVFLGNFPSEISVANGTAQFDIWAYGYLALIVVLAIVGMKVQFTEKNKKKQQPDSEIGVSLTGVKQP